MSQSYRYFLIPFTSVPQDPPYTVWYATWSTERPAIAPDTTIVPWAIGVIADAELPNGAESMGDLTKDPPPPPPLMISPTNAILSDYMKAFTQSLAAKGG